MAAELLLLRVSPFPLNHYKRSSQCILLRKVSRTILQKSQKAAVQSKSLKLLQRQSSATRAIENVSFPGLFEVLTVFRF